MVKVISRKKRKQSVSYAAPKGVQERLREAVKLHQSGNVAEAENHYREILRIDPFHPDALHLFGLTAHQTGRDATAVEYINKALQIDPSAPHYHNNLGNALLNLGRTEDAISCFKKALSLKPDYAGAYSNLGNAQRRKGNNKEALDCYAKALELAPGYVPVINNFANLLREAGRVEEAVGYYKKALELDPSVAETHFNLGNAYKDSGSLDDAVSCYQQTITLNPEFAAAYCNLANVYKKNGDYQNAIDQYMRAIEKRNDFAEAFNNLADTYRIQGRYHEAEELCLRTIGIRPDLAFPHVNLGNVYLERADIESAMRHYRRAVEIAPEYSDAHFNLSLVLLMKGDFEQGWKEYGWRFKSREIADQIDYRNHGIPEWDGSPLGGKKILVISEQGMGDQIQFARYVPLIQKMGGKTVLECHRELLPLFRTWDSLDELKEKPYEHTGTESPEVCVHLLNLPFFFRTDIDTIPADVPYLHADPQRVDMWREKLDNSMFNIGIVWAGNPDHRNDRNRSCGLEDYAEIAGIEGTVLYSLQKRGISPDIERRLMEMNIVNCEKELMDFGDTAALVECLDLVITVDTSVAHLAGAMGKDVWTLIPFIPDWRWMLKRDDTPWYPTMRLFRQSEDRMWTEVLKIAVEELKKIIKGRHVSD